MLQQHLFGDELAKIIKLGGRVSEQEFSAPEGIGLGWGGGGQREREREGYLNGKGRVTSAAQSPHTRHRENCLIEIYNL